MPCVAYIQIFYDYDFLHSYIFFSRFPVAPAANLIHTIL